MEYKKRGNQDFSMQLLFNRVLDRNGKPYYVSRDAGMSVTVDLGEVIMMGFPLEDGTMRMVIKPRLFDENGDPIEPMRKVPHAGNAESTRLPPSV